MTMTTNDLEARKILQAARVIALRARPYLAQALCAIQLREKAGIGTMACDAAWRVYYDPTTVRQWGAQNTAAGLLHEIGHLVRGHHARAKALGVTAATAREANIAQDCAINEHLICAGDTFALLATDSTPAKLGLPAGKTWEEYYGLLRAKAEQQQQGGGQGQPQQGKGQPGQPQQGAGCKCGSGATGVREAWEDAPPSDGGSDSGEAGEGDVPGLNEAEVRAVQGQTAQAVEAHEKKHGRGSAAGFGTWAAEKLAKPVTPWQQVLRGAVRSAVQYRRGAADFTYSRPSRRSSAVSGVVMPAMHAPVPQVAVVLDTSGSMGSRELQAALSEVEGVCRAVAAQVRVVTVDMVVHADKVVQNAKDVKIVGRGGTDMNAGIRRVVEGRRTKPCDVIVVITDGDTPMPVRADVPRDVRLIYCLVGSWARHARPPAWATSVIVPA
jgi:predicted metal-dependent peptidase